ncbi:protein lin-54 homolog [Sinocyclocheilus rhinocerous]|uniref:protein lin-54 homolog n=1 Tax=Sinocyclocheilus rhinocerous TaxID=307959 RepID=UPI0007B7E14C|nr:PREDICTED: protein lin-54 homolog [Sinocyclocheilus rhinocerous]
MNPESRQTLYKWRKFKIIVIVHEEPRVTSKQLKASLKLANINVHESTIRTTLNNYGVHGRVATRKPLLSKKNFAACLQFAKDHVDNVKWEKSKRPCNCTKSQCLKLYCECFTNGDVCNNCKCLNCYNNTEHNLERFQAIKACLDRNPGAFRPKIGSRKQGNVKGCHTKGCNCKRSGCLQNYCECYEAKIMCTSTCKCVGCRNYEESPSKKSFEQDRPDSSIYYLIRSPLACITPDVVEATCGCLLAQAEEAEKERYQECGFYGRAQ